MRVLHAGMRDSSGTDSQSRTPFSSDLRVSSGKEKLFLVTACKQTNAGACYGHSTGPPQPGTMIALGKVKCYFDIFCHEHFDGVSALKYNCKTTNW